jgi:two-component system CheB/CheR fusion protein
VVVGSSAGGVEALSVLVSTLQKGFPAPVVIAQHLDPTRASSLGSILERRSPLPVAVVEGRTSLQSRRVHRRPLQRQVAISTAHVVVEGDR